MSRARQIYQKSDEYRLISAQERNNIKNNQHRKEQTIAAASDATLAFAVFCIAGGGLAILAEWTKVNFLENEELQLPVKKAYETMVYISIASFLASIAYGCKKYFNQAVKSKEAQLMPPSQSKKSKKSFRKKYGSLAIHAGLLASTGFGAFISRKLAVDEIDLAISMVGSAIKDMCNHGIKNPHKLLTYNNEKFGKLVGYFAGLKEFGHDELSNFSPSEEEYKAFIEVKDNLISKLIAQIQIDKTQIDEDTMTAFKEEIHRRIPVYIFSKDDDLMYDLMFHHINTQVLQYLIATYTGGVLSVNAFVIAGFIAYLSYQHNKKVEERFEKRQSLQALFNNKDIFIDFTKTNTLLEENYFGPAYRLLIMPNNIKNIEINGKEYDLKKFLVFLQNKKWLNIFYNEPEGTITFDLDSISLLQTKQAKVSLSALANAFDQKQKELAKKETEQTKVFPQSNVSTDASVVPKRKHVVKNNNVGKSNIAMSNVVAAAEQKSEIPPTTIQSDGHIYQHPPSKNNKPLFRIESYPITRNGKLCFFYVPEDIAKKMQAKLDSNTNLYDQLDQASKQEYALTNHPNAALKPVAKNERKGEKKNCFFKTRHEKLGDGEGEYEHGIGFVPKPILSNKERDVYAGELLLTRH